MFRRTSLVVRQVQVGLLRTGRSTTRSRGFQRGWHGASTGRTRRSALPESAWPTLSRCGSRPRRSFSKEYFELVRANTVADNQLLASQRAGEELMVNLRGQTYLIR